MGGKETGGSAFPKPGSHWRKGEVDYYYDAAKEGMTLRQYAAIKLRVPDSGTDWLDEMIHTSLRDSDSINIIRNLIKGIREWGAEEDGVPDCVFDATLEAERFLEARDK